MSSKSQETTLTITDKDLSVIAERIAADPRCTMSKQSILNMMSAGLLGPKADWGRIRNAGPDLTSQRAQAKAAPATREIARQVELSCEEGGPLPVVLGIRRDGIHVTSKDGREIWIEHNDGCLKAHAYCDISDGPVSIWSKPGHVIRTLHEDHLSQLHPGQEGAPLTESDSWTEFREKAQADTGEDPGI